MGIKQVEIKIVTSSIYTQDHCRTLTWIPEILFMLRELKNNDGKLGVVGKGIAETVLI